MSASKIKCEHCGSTIKPYYNESYRGTRGKCPSCGVEFPLD